MSKDGEVTSEGKRLIDSWVAHRTATAHATERLKSAEIALACATKSLAQWLLPPDAQVGEKIAVWHGDSLVQVEVKLIEPHVVTVRTRGKRGLGQ